MMNRLRLLALALMAQIVAFAAPALPGWTTVTQSDGSTLTVTLCGDEHLHYYKTTDDVVLVRAANGDFCYADVSGFSISSSGVVAHEAGSRTAAEQCLLATTADVAASPLLMARAAQSRRRAQSAPRRALINDGTPKRALVILAAFSDQAFTSGADPQTTWSAILNEPGYNTNSRAIGSARDYYLEQSGGRFDLTFDVVGPVTLSKSCTYYGEDWPNGNIDRYAGEMIAEACDLVASEVDFSQYDWDGDGEVEQVFVLFAGHGSNVGGADKNLIWPHKYVVSAYDGYSGGLTYNGIKVNTYACAAELYGTGKNLGGIGTFCHEFSHCLGLPDFYNTRAGTTVLGQWDVMDQGCYNGYAWKPANYNGYERMFCGWAEPIELTTPTTVTDLEALGDGGAFYLIRNDCSAAGADEYYILENRQLTGWDAGLYGAGLLIFHVDYSASAWNMNSPNNTVGHRRFDLIRADNVTTNRATNAFPYIVQNDSTDIEVTALTDATTPAATVFNENTDGSLYMNKPVTDITLADGRISFKFMGGTPTAIDRLSADVEGQPADIYDLSGRHVMHVEAFTGREKLPKGVYIVKGINGKNIKIIR